MEVNMLPDEGRIGECFATDSAKVDLAKVIVLPDLVDILLSVQLVFMSCVVKQSFFKGLEVHATTSASDSNFVNFLKRFHPRKTNVESLGVEFFMLLHFFRID